MHRPSGYAPAPARPDMPACAKAIRNIGAAPDLRSYDHFVVAFSGGKDSLACLATLIEAGVPTAKIGLYHHDVDGAGESFMDWPCTTAYCRAVATAFNVPLYLSWKEGGFLREMLRDGTATAPIHFETPVGATSAVGGSGPPGTRLRFPQVTANLKQRWCSSYLKIDCMAALIRAQDRFLDARTLVVTGERAEESRARASYAMFEPDRTDTRAGTRRRRHVDHWRPVLRHTEADVWAMLQRHGVMPAPAYRLGWSRLSCIACIFGGPNQWCSLRFIAPDWFERISRYEDRFCRTIHRSCSIRELADRGQPYLALLQQPALAQQALSRDWVEPVSIPRSLWTLPAGAFGKGGGPT